MASVHSHKKLRRIFLAEFAHGLRFVWPILSGLLGLMASIGVVIGFLEDWTVGDGVYFAFVSGLTIGYGDLVPRHALSRILAICIGFLGVLLVGLFAAVGVRALESTTARNVDDEP